MQILERFSRLAERLHAYPWWQIAIELLVIWAVVYTVVRFVQGTRAAAALKGTLLLVVMATLLVRILGHQEAFQRLKFLYDNFLTLLAITLIVVFQPELRRGLIRLGEAPILRRSPTAAAGIAEAVSEACAYLSKAKFGGIIVLERDIGLRGLVEGGTPIHAKVTSRLLQTIFFPGSALHDLAVVIAGNEIQAAGVQLPLADPDEMPDASLGSRHRAAVGVTKESDALAVTVSEETGTISLAERGKLEQGLSPDQLLHELQVRLGRPGSAAASAAKGAGGTSGGGGNGAGGEPTTMGFSASSPDSINGNPITESITHPAAHIAAHKRSA